MFSSHFAAEDDHPAVINILIESGADPNRKNKAELRPVDVAGGKQSKKVLERWHEQHSPPKQNM